MVTDFDRLAISAKKIHEEIKKNQKETAEAENVLMGNIFRRAISNLEESVLPILNDAKSSFSKHDINLEVNKEYSSSGNNTVLPALEFCCLGPPQHDSYEFRSVMGSVSYVDGDFKFYVSRDTFVRKPDVLIVTVSDVKSSRAPVADVSLSGSMEGMLGRLLSSYYQEMRNSTSS